MYMLASGLLFGRERALLYLQVANVLASSMEFAS